MSSRTASLVILLGAALAPGSPAAAPPARGRLDRYGEPLPAGALARIGTVRLRPGSTTGGLAFLPGGKVLASWSRQDETIRFWDLATGRERSRLRGAGHVAFALSLPRPLLATGNEKGPIRLCDASTGREVRRLRASTDYPLEGLVFSPRQTVLASLHRNRVSASLTFPLVRLWRVDTGQLLQEVEMPSSMAPLAVALSPDDRVIALGGSEIYFVDVTTGRRLRRLSGLNDGLVGTAHLAFSPDGKTLASGGASEATPTQLWDVTTGARLDTFGGKHRVKGPITFLPGGKYLVVGGRPTGVWDVASRKEVRRLPTVGPEMTALAFSPDGNFLATAEHYIRLWDLRTGKEILPSGEHSGPVLCAAFSPDGKRLGTGGSDGTIRLWEPATGKHLARIAASDRPLTALLWCRDSRTLLSAGDASSVGWWDATTGKPLRRRDARASVVALALTPDGGLTAACTSDMPWWALALSTGTGENFPIRPIAFWNTATGDRASLPSIEVDGGSLGFGLGRRFLVTTGYPGGKTAGRLAAKGGGPGYAVRLWSLADGRHCCVLGERKHEALPPLAVSADGKSAATAAKDGTVRVWELATGQERRGFQEPQAGRITAIAFAPHEPTLALADSPGGVSLRDTVTGQERKRFQAPAPQSQLCFSPDGRQFASVGRDGTVLVWALPLEGDRRLVQARRTGSEMQRLLEDLAGAEAPKAYRALHQLAAVPDQSVPLLRGRLRPASADLARQIASWLAELAHDDFNVRVTAERRLEEAGEQAEPALHRALWETRDLEVRLRVKRLLGLLVLHPVSARQRWQLRAVEVLERSATPEARSVLEALAKGAPEAHLTQDAAQALQRLAGRPAAARAAERSADVVVYGATASGVLAAVAVAREGKTVLLLEPGTHVGGMVAGGLGATDTGNRAAIGGYAREFFDRVRAHYVKKYGPASRQVKDCSDGFHFEPHVATAVFNDLLKQAKIKVLFGQRLVSVVKNGPRLISLKTAAGDTFKARVFIDAGYEGDLLAAAGVKYHVGREGRSVYGEPLAGVQRHSPFHQWPVRISGLAGKERLPFIQSGALAGPGTGDRKVQAYNFRLCMTDDPANRVAFPRPKDYDPDRYELLARYLKARPGLEVGQLMNPVRMPNRKTDTNNNGPFSTDHIGANWDYPEAGHARRQRIAEDHVRYTQGFLYFLANDRRVPRALHDEINRWGLAKDEFTDNGHWPTQLYVREARRMIGVYVMTQADVTTRRTKDDSVGLGSYTADSHHVQRILRGDGSVLNEGDFQVPVSPYAIPYRSLIPRPGECDNLLVPVCLSASHVAYGSIRMEPVYMILGQACGVAAALAVGEDVAVQNVAPSRLVARLKKQKAVLSPDELPKVKASVRLDPKKMRGVVVDDEQAELTGDWKRSGVMGPFVGSGYRHDGDADKGKLRARFTPKLPRAGRYEVRLYYAPASNRAANALVVVHAKAGEKTFRVDQRRAFKGGEGLLLGTFDFDAAGGWVEVRNDGTKGHVIADAVQFIPAR